MIKHYKATQIQGRYLHKFFLYFLFYACIPLLTIILLYARAEGAVKEQIVLSSQNTLDQFYYLIEAAAEEMSEIAVSLANREELQNYSAYVLYQPEKAAYKIYEIRQILGSLMQQKYLDIIVYFPEEKRVISAENASLSLDYFYDTYYRSADYDFREEFIEALNYESKRPGFQVIERPGAESWLCVSTKQPGHRNSRMNYTVTLILKPEYMNGLVESSPEGTAGTLLMFDGDRRLLFCSDGGHASYTLEGYEGIPSLYEKKFGEETYVMQVKKSQVLDGYYASAVPREYFWKKLSQLRMICGIGGVLCVSFSVLLSYKSASRAYRPINNMVSRLQEESGIRYGGEWDSEFDFIEALFRKENEEKRLMRRKMKIGERMSHERFLLSLFDGSVEGDSSGDDVFRKNGIMLQSDRFFVGCLYVEKSGTFEDRELLPFIIRNVFTELCSRNHQGYVANLSGSEYAILVNQKYEAKAEEMIRIFQEGAQFLRQYYDMEITAGTGLIHEGMAGIKNAYEEAEQALRYRYIMGTGCIIAYEEIQDRSLHYLPSSESRLSNLVMEYIRENVGTKTVKQFVSELMDTYRIDEESALETVECFKFDAVNAVNMASMFEKYSAAERREMIRQLLSGDTLDDFRNCFSYIIMSLQQKELERVSQHDECRRARDYIEENYADPSLSVSMLGREMNISPSYLSRLFKEKYGISIPDYVTRIRLQNAKLALCGTRKSVNDIAVENGFLSSNVFIKAFKKQEGITPGVYRELT